MGNFRLSDLNPPQLEAVKTVAGPVLILAGAGTGKTRVITARIAWLLHTGTPADQILAVTFTNKAAGEMRERIAGMIDGEEARKLTIGTFHSLCVRILRAGIDRLGYKHNFTIYDEGDQLSLLRKIITRTAAKDEKLDPHAAKNLISQAKNKAWNPPEDDRTLLGAVYARYNEELRQLNAVDFDDLLLLARKLLAEHEDVRQRLQDRYRQIMVDEFQDTNRLQLDLISLLAGNPPNVCVVGDDDQSIYGWRGAEVANLLEFERHFPNPTVIKLEQNYRSTNTILNAANALIRNNPRRRPKSLWSDRGDGPKIRAIRMADDREEASFVAGEIRQRQIDEGLPWEAFAILFRMNAQSRLFEEQLRGHGIPYRLIGGKSFFDRREIKDVISYANTALNPSDDVSVLRIINTPPRGIGEGTVETALHESVRRKCALWDILNSEEYLGGLSRARANAVRTFVNQIETLRIRLATPGADSAELLGGLLTECSYFDDLKRSCKTADEGLDRESNIRQLLSDLREFEKRKKGGLTAFLDALALRNEREEEKKDDQGSGVTLITLHAAKGLEFPHVYLVGLEEGILPHDRSKMEGSLDEERRLLYVGITRAMKTLALTWCNGRTRYGSVAPAHRSSFLAELPAELVETVDASVILSIPATQEDAAARFGRLRAALGA